MPSNDFKSVEEYLEAQPAGTRAILKRVRAAIRKGAPQAGEVISYKIPAYKMNGRAFLYFAGWKQHYSLYPAGANLVAAFRNELAPYEVAKGTIRFPLADPVPSGLITRIAKFRAEELSARTARSAGPERAAKKSPRK